MYIIVTGDPVGGFSFYGDERGLGYEDVDEAVTEAERLFKNMDWWIITVGSISDLE